MNHRSRSLRSLVTEDGAVILDIEHDVIFTLNPIGGYVWAKLAAGCTLDQIIAYLVAESGIDITTAERDVRTFVDTLIQQQLINTLDHQLVT
jgi:hypothetical protein